MEGACEQIQREAIEKTTVFIRNYNGITLEPHKRENTTRKHHLFTPFFLLQMAMFR